MVYLYAGLGIAMISGISAMMQIGMNLNNMEGLFKLKENPYDREFLIEDRQIMKKLYTQTVPDNDICSYIKNSVEDLNFYKIGNDFDENNYKKTYSRSPLFFEACALVSPLKGLPKEDGIRHRVLIVPKKEGKYKYGLFSCVMLRGESYCDFEDNPINK